MASGTINNGILGDATYKRLLLTNTNVFTGTIYLTRIGPFAQISGSGINLINDLAENSRVYANALIPSGYRANRDFPVTATIGSVVLANARVYINGAGTLFFTTGSGATIPSSASITLSGLYIVSSYGATDTSHD